MKKNIKLTFIIFLVLCIVQTITFATEPSGEIEYDNYIEETNYSEINYENITIKAKVIEAGEPYIEIDEYAGQETTQQNVKVKINDGERFAGKEFDVKYSLSYYLDNVMVADRLNVNDSVYVYLNLENGEISNEPYIQYFDKSNLIIWMIVIYSLAIIIVGGMKGMKALVSLIITVLAIFFIMIPSIFNGYDAILVTILTSIVVTIITLVIVGGISKKTLSAMIGTSSGIVAAGLFAMLFGNLMKLSGVGENSYMLSTIENGSRFDFEGIMFAGIIIGALGACMDVGMSISSAIQELKNENPRMTVKDLIKSGMNIGKDIMGTMTNTLILAYVGSAITIILIFMGFDFKLYEVINQETIAEEILRAIAGSFGIIFTIPLTTIVSSFFMGRRNKDYER